MTVLAFLTFLIASSLQGGETPIGSVVMLVCMWLSLVGGLAVFGIFIVGTQWRRRREVLVMSTTCLLLGLAGGGITAYWEAEREYPSINTAEQARPLLEMLLKQRESSLPGSFKSVDLGQQIRKISVSGPQMSFDPEDTRYIEFEFDTGCGEIVRAIVISGPGLGSELSPFKSSCSP